MHAIAMIWRVEYSEQPSTADLKSTQSEPYYSDEALSELGLSWERAVNGGTDNPFLSSMDHKGLQLGSFVVPGGPSLTEVSMKGPSTAILRNPLPRAYDDYYPLPIVFYSDIQNNAFWDTGVKAYSHSILYYRALTVGSRVHYILTTPADAERLESTIDDSRSTQKVFDFSGRPGKTDFGITMARYKNIMSKAPRALPVVKFGEALIKSSLRREEFWNASTRADAHSLMLIGKIDKGRQNLDFRTYYRDLWTCADEAIANHEQVILAHNNLRIARVGEMVEEKRALLKWNKGTRLFLKQLTKIVDPHGHHPAYHRLEICFLALLDPPDLSANAISNSTIEDEVTLFQLQIAFKKLMGPLQNITPQDVNDIQGLCNKLMQDEGVSWYVSSCVHILQAWIRADNPQGRDTRLAAAEEGWNRLQALLTGSSDEWKAIIAKWAGMLSVIRSKSN